MMRTREGINLVYYTAAGGVGVSSCDHIDMARGTAGSKLLWYLLKAIQSGGSNMRVEINDGKGRDNHLRLIIPRESITI